MADNLRHAQYGADGVQIDDPQSIYKNAEAVQASSILKTSAGKFKLQGKQIGFELAGITNICVFAQFADGRYLCTSTTDGSFAQRLFILTGDPLGAYTVEVLAQTSCAAANALKDTAGVTVGGANAGIFNAWIAPNQDVWFIIRGAVDTKNYLFRCKYGTWTVGSDAGFSNKRASIDVGMYGGVQSEGIRHLSNQSLLFATVAGAVHIFFCEYNVAPGRVAGSGGAGKDQAIAYRSTNGGDSFSVFLEFNTAGSHVIDHFHGARQCPYSGWIYFMTGDDGAESNIIGYNGTAAPVAANASLATIGATAGYKVIGGNEVVRWTDALFTPQGLYSIPDCDAESQETSTTAFVSVYTPKMLEYVSTIAPAARADKLPPLLAFQRDGWGAMLSFRTHTSPTDPEPYLWIWTTDYEAGSWTLVAKVRNYLNVTAIPKSWFIDNIGRAWIGGTFGGGTQFVSTTQSGSSVCLIPVTRQDSGLPKIFGG